MLTDEPPSTVDSLETSVHWMPFIIESTKESGRFEFKQETGRQCEMAFRGRKLCCSTILKCPTMLFSPENMIMSNIKLLTWQAPQTPDAPSAMMKLAKLFAI